MEGKLEEMEKEMKFAQMLMKTYVDQIAREKVKIERAREQEELVTEEASLDGNKENHFKKSNTRRGSSAISSMVTIRNNEGKVCKSKTVLVKKKTKRKRCASKKGQDTIMTTTLGTTIEVDQE